MRVVTTRTERWSSSRGGTALMGLILLVRRRAQRQVALAVALARALAAPSSSSPPARPATTRWRERIAQHRAERPADWTTVEEPLDARRALRRAPAADVVVVDCLSLWVANLLEPRRRAAEARRCGAASGSRLARAAGRRSSSRNEVGIGHRPRRPLGARLPRPARPRERDLGRDAPTSRSSSSPAARSGRADRRCVDGRCSRRAGRRIERGRAPAAPRGCSTRRRSRAAASAGSRTLACQLAADPAHGAAASRPRRRSS